MRKCFKSDCAIDNLSAELLDWLEYDLCYNFSAKGKQISDAMI